MTFQNDDFGSKNQREKHNAHPFVGSYKIFQNINYLILYLFTFQG